jgi:hypothetical protein
MKKLMILAAVAAIAGGAFADVGYNFSATLKTTKGRLGKDVITTLNLGQNALLGFWYQDHRYAEITNILDGAWYDTKVIQGRTIPTVAKATDSAGETYSKTGKYLWAANEADGTSSSNYIAVVKLLGELHEIYHERSAGVYCETVKVVDPAKCYRVAGSKKINQDFYEDWNYEDCCEETFAGPIQLGAGAYGPAVQVMAATPVVFDNGEMAIAYQTTQTNGLSLVNTLYQRFGSQADLPATSLEIYAAVPYAVTDDGYIFAGWFAGQGQVLQRGFMDARTISGNIVGIITAPTCENCCADPTLSVVFDCVNDTFPETLPYSAAYGTFRFRYVTNLR